jgi:hypothetical protein
MMMMMMMMMRAKILKMWLSVEYVIPVLAFVCHLLNVVDAMWAMRIASS